MEVYYPRAVCHSGGESGLMIWSKLSRQTSWTGLRGSADLMQRVLHQLCLRAKSIVSGIADSFPQENALASSQRKSCLCCQAFPGFSERNQGFFRASFESVVTATLNSFERILKELLRCNEGSCQDDVERAKFRGGYP
jgi:hypothetical protein